MRKKTLCLFLFSIALVSLSASSQVKVQERPSRIKPLASSLFKPSIPGDFSADGYSMIETIVTWRQGTGTVTAYEIEEKVGSAAPSVRRIPAGSGRATYMYSGPSVAACYRIRACGSNGNSDWSNAACATTGIYKTPPPAPGNLRAEKVSGTQINLTCQTETMLRKIEGFVIEFKKVQAGGQYSKIATLRIKSIDPASGEIRLQSDSSMEEYRSFNGTTTYPIRFSSPIPAGVTYCYQIKAFNNAGNSAYTNEACLTYD